MNVPISQCDEYMVSLGREYDFMEAVPHYDKKQANVQARQLRRIRESYQYYQSNRIRETVQMCNALHSNVKELDEGKVPLEDIVSANKAWISYIPTGMEYLINLDQKIELITRFEGLVYNRIAELKEISSYAKRARSQSGANISRQTSQQILNSTGISGNLQILPNATPVTSLIVTSPLNTTSLSTGQLSTMQSTVRAAVCSYEPDCPICLEAADYTFSFCLGKCVTCSGKRKTRKQVRQHPDGLVNTNDKYYFVTLTAEREDGSNEYISEALTKNFRKMFPKSYPARAYCYSIGLTPEGVPFLNGLIRFDDRGKHNISTKSTHITNLITSMNTGARNLRVYNVISITKLANKRQQTQIRDVLEKYRFITSQGQVIGVTEEEMIAPDQN